MKANNNSPAIRFAGFTAPWERRKLKDYLVRYDNLRIPVSSSKRVPGSTPYYGANGIQDYVEGYTHDGQFILVAEDGANDLKNYPVQYVFGKVWVNNHAHVLQAIESIADNLFFKYSISQTDIEPFLVGGGRAKLNAETMMNIETSAPTKAEQVSIGLMLGRLDNLITYHQRKYEKLVNLKKAMLDKMFPKNGELVPEVRFAGFSGNWERRELGEICSEITRRDPYSQATVMMISAASGFIEQSVKYAFNNAGSSLTGYTLLKRGELAYNHGASKERKYGSCFSLNVDEARVPFVYHCFDVGDNNPSFVATCLNNDRIDIQLRRLVSSSARMDGLLNISFAQYKTIEIELPPIKEQEQIAMLIDKIDQLVKLYKQELGRLQNIKKAFLEKMFV